MKLLGAVLAGGESRRFGSDKALALLNGTPLIDHAIAALAAQTDAVIVCGREGGDWAPDRPGPGLGPLGGINAAIHQAAARGYDAVLTCGCDVPVLPADLAPRLRAAGPAAFLAGMPVIGLWPAALAGALDAHLNVTTDRSVRCWARLAGAVAVTLDTAPPNVNTPQDLARLLD
ncbi:molybdenum cofactor guanylyltransferase [Sphingomonas sp. G-3-2-10]|uniref:molybdenum cofactor guanylyltransferase n=1 Tax=Sphingomonas sp. G-3-2-10 TaxID=2728838 RepID=UPI00146EF080|nr:molybdenum cofactor guanylyltransferase [Sphingomonas sp. G-3-2-10]NML05414.1 molybdenum cofactor guanylyltransferase [Sphingomonas sp. G-3-2-10]